MVGHALLLAKLTILGPLHRISTMGQYDGVLENSKYKHAVLSENTVFAINYALVTS